MYSTLKPTNRFTRNSRCPCSNDYDDHGDFSYRHKANPPDEPHVDGRWCDVQHQEHMTVQSSWTQNNMGIRHSSYSATFLSASSSSPKNPKNSTENAPVLIVSPIDVLSHLSTTQCPNRLQCCNKPCTISCYDTDSTRACHMAQDACSFPEQNAVCTTALQSPVTILNTIETRQVGAGMSSMKSS